MKKFIALLIVVAIVFIAYNRQRLFIRDPLASVLRDGIEDKGAQVFINYSNDVLLENDNPPMYVTLVQHGQPIGLPANLKCVHWVVCLTDADVATLSQTEPSPHADSMTSKLVEFHDERKRAMAVKLR